MSLPQHGSLFGLSPARWSYLYGGNNELLSVTYADNSAFNFNYDGNLRLTSATDALGNIVESHSYDGQGRAITSEKQGGVNHYSLSYVKY